jgi:hypothetical protein
VRKGLQFWYAVEGAQQRKGTGDNVITASCCKRGKIVTKAILKEKEILGAHV